MTGAAFASAPNLAMPKSSAARYMSWEAVLEVTGSHIDAGMLAAV